MKIRAEDLLKEDAIKPNILDAVRDLEREVARMQRAKRIEANVGEKAAAHNVLSPERNLVTVAQEGGDFETITEALISIEDASAINRYTILVYPGIYDEQVVMKEYVALVGLDRDVCIIESADHLNLVTLASNSSLNELTIRNTNPILGDTVIGIYGEQVTNFLIDSCIVIATTVGAFSSAYGLLIVGCNNMRLLGSEFCARGIAYTIPIYISVLGFNATIEVRNCKAEVLAGTIDYAVGILFETDSAHNLTARIIASIVKVPNTIGMIHNGIYVDTVGGGTITIYVVATDVIHTSTAGGGDDLNSLGNSIIYVRGVSYSTWFIDGGQIIPLAGDRPRLASVRSLVDFTITAGAGAWQNDPQGVLTIDLPCESDLKIDASILWYSDVGRDRAFEARALVDGVPAVGSLDLAGTIPVGVSPTTMRMVYTLTGQQVNVTAGLHTIQLQVSRANAADTVVVDTREITVMSDPWP